MTLTSDFNPTNPVPFSRMRYLLSESGGGLQAGVVGANDFKVVQRGAGANMSVDVGTGGAWVAVTTGTRNGLAHCFNDATANVTITAAHATLPRLDQICLRYNDSNIPTGSGDIPTLAVATGTATSGATLDNRNGAVALPADSLRLADVIVAAADTSITNSEIRDRRPWARGAYFRIVRNANAAAGANYSITTTFGLVDATNLQPRIECSGVPLVVSVNGRILSGVQAAHHDRVSVWIDATGHDGMSTTESLWRQLLTTATSHYAVNLTDTIVPSAGSHLIGLAAGTDLGTDSLVADTTIPLIFTVQELVRPNASNT